MRTATDFHAIQAPALALVVGTRPFDYWTNIQEPKDCAQTGR